MAVTLYPGGSTVIQGVEYDPNTKDLLLRLQNGGLYLYNDVDPESVCRLLFSNSMGKYFAQEFKKAYKGKKLE